MKHIFVLFVLLIAVNIATAQIPSQISWQGVLQDSQGELLDGNYDLTVKLYDVATGGTALWSETHNGLAITDGLVNLILGSINDLNLSFDSQYWLEITIGTGTPLSRIMLTSVPYAMYAKKAPNEIQGEPLILRDSDGNMRMRLNPDEGIFEMFDEEEELWYSMQVNSPVKTLTKNSDGTYTVSSGSFGQGLKETFREDGTLVSSEETRMTVDEDFITEIINFNPAGGIVSREKIIENTDDNGNTFLSKEIFFFNDYRQQIKRKKQKFINGELIEEEVFGLNDQVESRIEITSESITSYVYDHEGNFLFEKIVYPESNSSIVESGYDITSFQHSPTQFTFDGKVQINGPAYLTNGLNVTTGNTSLYNTITTNLTVYNSASFSQGITAGQTSTFNNANFSGKIKSEGNVETDGSLIAQGPKPFRIEHPNDDTKYLLHAAMESNEVLNTYTGNVFTDDDGYATVTLPDYFSLINSGANIRYQLTIIGNTFARAIVYSEIDDNEFIIKTDEPNIKVSWQVIAKRNDQYMLYNPFYDVIDK